MKVTTIGIDLAKNVFQIHGVNEHGKATLRKQLKRDQMASFFATLAPCLIGMEACGSAHHWARKLQGFGHTVRLMAPQLVKPYVMLWQGKRSLVSRDLSSLTCRRGAPSWLKAARAFSKWRLRQAPQTGWPFRRTFYSPQARKRCRTSGTSAISPRQPGPGGPGSRLHVMNSSAVMHRPASITASGMHRPDRKPSPLG